MTVSDDEFDKIAKELGFDLSGQQDDDLEAYHDNMPNSPGTSFFKRPFHEHDQPAPFFDFDTGHEQQRSVAQQPRSYNDILDEVSYDEAPSTSTSFFDAAPWVQPSRERQGATRHSSLTFANRNDDPRILITRAAEASLSSLMTHERSVQLYPVSRLPDDIRSLFSFPVFNAVQSICLPTILNSDEDVVISAPTGSGKTVLFELALVHMLLTKGSNAKAVYLAPTKALCNEKAKDWLGRFEPLGFRVAEFTGDSAIKLATLKKAQIIISTPEKWDSLTRKWRENEHLLSMLKLVLVDEVHILNEPGRGPKVEVVVSRIKARGHGVRFIAVSATIPNLDDIGTWIGTRASNSSAKVFRFGEEYRPCPLQKFVYGYPYPNDEWTFQATLNHKLFDLIKKHAGGRPCLVFVATRKATGEAAQIIAKQARQMQDEEGRLPWKRPVSSAAEFQDDGLQSLAELGIATHHAGLSLADRREVERRFLSEDISVLCSTSTLATGVNLPAFCVILRGTKKYEGEWKDASDLDVIQMMGRAGRPQFDTNGVAIIMCDQGQESRYRELAEGTRDIESTLGKELIEHVNAEIFLSGRSSVHDIQRWLKGTFFFVRVQKDPSRYLTSTNGEVQAVSADSASILETVCTQAVTSLEKHGLITRRGAAKEDLESTTYGEIMSHFSLQFKTMLTLLSMEANSGLKDVLQLLCQAEEFGDLRIRQGEKSYLQALRAHPEIRFPPKGINGIADKVSLLIQAALACVNLKEVAGGPRASFNPILDTYSVFRHAPRLARALMDVSLERRDGSACKAAFDLIKSLYGRAWDSSPVVLRQLDNIGEKSIKALAAGGIATFEDLVNTNAYRIELLLNRNPPFGSKLIEMARSFPRFDLQVTQISVQPKSVGDEFPQVLIEISFEMKDRDRVAMKGKNSGLPLGVCVLTLSSELDLHDYRRMPLKKLTGQQSFQLRCPLRKASHRIVVYIACDEVAGSTVRAELRPDVRGIDFPTPAMHDAGDAEASEDHAVLLEGLENDPGLFAFDSSDDELPLWQGSKANSKQKKLTTLDEEAPPARMANGNYKCNHKCKGSCRHICCREGMPRPPKRSGSHIQQPRKGHQATREEDPDSSDYYKNRTVPKEDAHDLLERITHLNSLNDSRSALKAQITTPPNNDRRARLDSSSDSDLPLLDLQPLKVRRLNELEAKKPRQTKLKIPPRSSEYFTSAATKELEMEEKTATRPETEGRAVEADPFDDFEAYMEAHTIVEE